MTKTWPHPFLQKARQRSLAIAIAVATSLVPCTGNSQDLFFHKLTVEEGLSQNSVLCFAQDRQGYMWIGTSAGLNRFDSRSFKVFKKQQNEPGSLSNDYILSLLNDSRDMLWVGTAGGLNVYDNRTATFAQYHHTEGKPGSLNSNRILSLYEDRKGRIWVGTAKGLNFLSTPGGKNFEKIDLAAPANDPSGGEIRAIREDFRGNIWVSASNGVYRISRNFSEYIIKKFHIEAPGKLPEDLTCTSIEEDEDRNLWFGTIGAGLFLFDESNSTFDPVANASNDKTRLPHDYIRKLKADGNRKLWIGTQEGLSVLDIKTRSITSTFQHDPEDRNSLSQNSIYDIFLDRTGNIWTGTYYGGVSMAYAKKTPFKLIQASGKNIGLSNNVVSAIFGNDAKGLWFGSDGGGLNYLDQTSGKFSHYKYNVKNPRSIGSNLVKTIFRDSSGSLWIGTHGGGLNLFNEKSGEFTRFKHIKGRNSISSNDVLNMIEDNEGTLWIGTENNGLNSFDRQKQEFSTYHPDSAGNFHLEASQIKSMIQDLPGNIWLGTENGLFVKQKNAAGFRHYEHKFSDGKTYPSSQMVGSLYLDQRQQIWVGTVAHGIYLIQPGEDRLLNFTKKDGLPSNNIKGMIEDDAGNIWITTDKGLCKSEPGYQDFVAFNVYDGLPGNDFNPNSFYRHSTGEIYIGGLNGIVHFQPSEIQKNNSKSTIVFSSLKIGNDVVDALRFPQVLQTDISFASRITLNHQQNDFTIDFRLLNYIKPSKNTYVYKLEGFDNDWVISENGSATYTNLPTGTYRLQVKAANNDGIWANNTAMMEVRVNPPLWASKGAYFLYFLISAFFIYLLIRYFRIRVRYRQEQELQQYKLDFFTNISHEIRTRLTLIATPLETMQDMDLPNDGVRKQIQNIRKHTQKLSTLVSELMDFRKAETGNLQLNCAPTDLKAYLAETIQPFGDAAMEKGIRFEISLPEAEVSVLIDKAHFEKVITNLLTNAIKFTGEGGKLGISLDVQKNAAIISIWDTGIGISPANVRKLFTNYFQVSNEKSENTGYGIGLALSRSIVELHNGTIEVASTLKRENKEGYTVFRVKLPMQTTFYEQIGRDKTPTPDDIDKSALADTAIEKASKPVLLIVEDNDDLREFMKDSLSTYFDIHESSDGKMGLSMAQKLIPELIISDIMMPEMDGLELCRCLKSDMRTSHIPVILLTAKSTINDQISGLEENADAYITKPFNLTLLITQIKNLIENRKRLQLVLRNRYLKLNDTSNEEVMRDRFLEEIVLFIEGNLENAAFSVGVLAKHAAMSQPVLYKKIKALTGMSVNDFIKSIRLKKAAGLLQSKKHTIYEVAYMVGFSDRKYFSKEFKKAFGMSPTMYMERDTSDSDATFL